MKRTKNNTHRTGRFISQVAASSALLISSGLWAHTALAEKDKEDKKADPKKSEEVATKKASSFPDTVKDPQPGEIIVKCAGIVKKGKNHCGANGHECDGLSAKDDKIKDFDPNEWIYVRPEVCEATPGKVVGKKKVEKG